VVWFAVSDRGWTASATLADVFVPAALDDGAVRIEISFDSGLPPSGTVLVDGRAGDRFDGWLGLLNLLAAALEPEPRDERED
jgi:hypothetical protein